MKQCENRIKRAHHLLLVDYPTVIHRNSQLLTKSFIRQLTILHFYILWQQQRYSFPRKVEYQLSEFPSKINHAISLNHNVSASRFKTKLIARE